MYNEPCTKSYQEAELMPEVELARYCSKSIGKTRKKQKNLSPLARSIEKPSRKQKKAKTWGDWPGRHTVVDLANLPRS